MSRTARSFLPWFLLVHFAQVCSNALEQLCASFWHRKSLKIAPKSRTLGAPGALTGRVREVYSEARREPSPWGGLLRREGL